MKNRIPSLNEHINEGLESELKNVSEEDINNLRNEAENKISIYKQRLSKNLEINGWKVHLVTNPKEYPHADFIFNKPILVIFKDKWRYTYYGFLWGWEFVYDTLKHSGNIKTKLVAKKIDGTSESSSNFIYSKGYIKWSEEKLKIPSIPIVPQWEETNE